MKNFMMLDKYIITILFLYLILSFNIIFHDLFIPKYIEKKKEKAIHIYWIHYKIKKSI